MQQSRRNAVVTLLLGALTAGETVLDGHVARAQRALEKETADGIDQDRAKAEFLYHFGMYVEWPAPPANDAINIAVLGSAAVAEELRKYLPGRTVQGRAVTVRQIGNVEELEDDQILFIGASLNGRLGELVRAVGPRPVLIVSDAQDGLAQGAMVNFQLVDRRVRFEISQRAAQTVGLTLSSRLLSAALRVETASRVTPLDKV